MDDKNVYKYKSLINSLYNIIGSIENSKESVKKIPDSINTGIQINEEKLEKQIVENTIDSLNNSKKNLYSVISSCKRSIND